MRNISFALTTPQFLAGSKTVTRRLGWKNLKPGERLMAVEKGQGLRKGEKVKRLGLHPAGTAAAREAALSSWRDQPVTMEFLADLFDAYSGADGHNLVVMLASNAAKRKL